MSSSSIDSNDIETESETNFLIENEKEAKDDAL